MTWIGQNRELSRAGDSNLEPLVSPCCYMQGLNELSCARVSATHAFGSFDHSFSRHFEWKLWADLAGQWSEIIGWNAVEGVQWLGPQECPTDAPDNSHPPQPSS